MRHGRQRGWSPLNDFMAVVLSTLLVMAPTGSVDPDANGGAGAQLSEGAADVWAEETPPSNEEQTAADAAVSPAAVTLARYVYACADNTYGVDPPINEACEAAVQGCTEDVQARQYFRWTTRIMSDEPVPPPGPAWTIAGTVCIAPAEAEQAEVTVTLADFRRLPLPPAQPAIQPAGGEALIRMRTNAYVDPTSTRPQTFDITLLDTPVQVRATPTTYTWDFGDGSPPLETADPGAPYPDLTTWHEYQAPGTVQITLTTTYTGEYSVAGGPWTPIPGTAQVSSEPQQLQLLTTTNKLTG
jgi:hypothetical protein